MTCSSSTISRSEPLPAWGRRRWGAWRLAVLPALVAAPLAIAATPGPGEGSGTQALIDRARAAITRGDGIDAEMKLREALARGASHEEVAAWMGEAYLVQGNRDKARQWLENGDFGDGSAANGWRALAALERLDGDLAAAGIAYDRALAITPDDAALWVEIGRLRYARGEHLQAIQAADHALELEPGNVRALEFGGQLVRDRRGLLAALPWFKRAIAKKPDDVSVLLEYAATLGELGRAGECLTATRRVLEIRPGNARAFYLQAVLAARAGDYDLARGLLDRTKGRLGDRPGPLLLRGVVELGVGNPSAAAEVLERVLQMRPDSRRARDLLARAIYLSGQYRYAAQRFAGDIHRGDASPYLLTVVARAYEALGDRQKAGELLDHAARPQTAELRVLPGGSRIGALLAQGQASAAEAAAEAARRGNPGFYDNLSRAGDVQLALGRPQSAQDRYVAAAAIRMPESLFERRFQAYMIAGDVTAADRLAEGYLRQHPASRAALRAVGRLALMKGDIARARFLLAWLRDNGGARDVQLLSDLAILEAEAGDAAAAEGSALAAYRLQRSSPVATQALAFSYAASGRHRGAALALLEKARAMLGDTPLIAEARRMLAGDRRI